MPFRDIFEEAALSELASMEFKSRRMEMLREMTGKCKKEPFIWRQYKEGKYYCVSPDDCPCEYRRESEEGSIHRYRCRKGEH